MGSGEGINFWSRMFHVMQCKFHIILEFFNILKSFKLHTQHNFLLYMNVCLWLRT